MRISDLFIPRVIFKKIGINPWQKKRKFFDYSVEVKGGIMLYQAVAMAQRGEPSEDFNLFLLIFLEQEEVFVLAKGEFTARKG